MKIGKHRIGYWLVVLGIVVLALYKVQELYQGGTAGFQGMSAKSYLTTAATLGAAFGLFMIYHKIRA